MAERITICFEMEKNDLLNMFQEEVISKAVDEFMQEYFASYIKIHENYITHNVKAAKQEIEELEIQQIVLSYLKSCIEKEDLEEFQIEVAKELFKESFTNMTEPNIAIYKALKTNKVIAIAEKMQKKLRDKYLCSSV